MNATVIRTVDAWQVLDSRGGPTVACAVTLASGASGVASVPAGASTGRHEARELRDGGEPWAGRGVTQAVANVRCALRSAVVGADAHDQRRVDELLRAADGTTDLGRLGANAVLAVSLATSLAAAGAVSEPLYRHCATGEPLLPMPMVNILSGGAHAGHALDFQDFLVVPTGAESFSQAISWCAEVRRRAAELAAERGAPASLVADEGGLGVALGSNRAAVELLSAAIERAGLRAGEQAAIAIDVAATQFVDADGRYHLAAEQRTIDGGQLAAELVRWCEMYPIVSLEDPLAEDDWDSWALISECLGGRIQLLGDDLFVTNSSRLAYGIDAGVANAVLVKPNQAGTVTAAADVVRQARRAGYRTVLSARSGETEDSWLADFAVGWRTGQIKVGSTTRSERTAKWNRLLAIEHELGTEIAFARWPQPTALEVPR